MNNQARVCPEGCDSTDFACVYSTALKSLTTREFHPRPFAEFNPKGLTLLVSIRYPIALVLMPVCAYQPDVVDHLPIPMPTIV